jgi:hypothetical protein
MMKPTTCFVVLLLALVSGSALTGVAAAAEVYQWTDENGVMHFSDQKPEGRDAAVRNLPEHVPPTGPNPYEGAQSESSAAQERREEIAQKGRESQAQKALTEQRCSAWQAEVDRLEPSRRVFQTNEQGETVRMDDVARTNRVAELKSLIAKNCR